MVRILWFFILTVILYWAVKGLFPKGERKGEPGHAGEEMVQDPNCGVYLPKNTALSHTLGRKKLYFCSEECLKAYKGRAEGEERRAQD